MKKYYSKTPKDSITTFSIDDLRSTVSDETKEYKELCKEIDATREMDLADITTNAQSELSEIGNKNPFFDNTWGCPRIKNNLFRSQEQQSHYNSLKSSFTEQIKSNNSLIIPSDANYGYYPKNLNSTSDMQNEKNEMNIIIPSDSEEEIETIFKNNDKDYKAKSPFNYSNRMRETFVCSSPNEDSSINANETINNSNEQRKYQFRTPVNNMLNRNRTTFQLNQTIGKYPSNGTPTTIASSYLNSSGFNTHDYSNAFSFSQGMPEVKVPFKKSFKKDCLEQNDFTMNIEKIICGKDHRTTLMIKNIPVKYSSEELIFEIQKNFIRKFDLFYLPMDYKNENNLGFAFINFIDPLHIIHFLHYYKGRKWLKYKSNKECDLFYAKFQGKEELIAHLKKNSKKTGEEKKALIFPIKKPFPRIALLNVRIFI